MLSNRKSCTASWVSRLFDRTGPRSSCHNRAKRPSRPLPEALESRLMLSVSNFVINEIFAHPPDSVAGDANRDGTSDAAIDEFVEIVNYGATTEDISGWTISDGASVRHTFPAAKVIPEAQAIVKFVGVRIMGVKLTGGPNSRHLTVQPAVFSDSHVLRGDLSVNVDSILSQPVPVH